MYKKTIVPVIVASILTGCASGLNSVQEHEYIAMKSSNMLVKEKDPSTGAWLGLLPGGGSFYTGHPGLGVLNLLFWPLSIFWDPVSGYDGAKNINYEMTRAKIKKDKAKEIDALDDQHMAGKLNTDQYLLEKKKVEHKYDFDAD